MAEGASLTVLGGPLAGTQLTIDDAVDEILVGSDPDCRLSLDLPGVSPLHARIWRDLAGMTVYDTRSPRGVYVNDARVVDQAALRDGDVLWLGEPGDPDSVMLQCRLPEDLVLGAPAGEDAARDSAGRPAMNMMDELDLEEPAAAAEGVAREDPMDGILAADARTTAVERAPVAAPPEAPVFEPPAQTPAFEPPPETPVFEPPAQTLAFEPPAEAPVFEPPPQTPAFELPTEPPVFEPPPQTPAFEPPTEPPVFEPPAEAPATQAAEDFVMDPSWAEEPPPPPPAADLDSLVADAPPASSVADAAAWPEAPMEAKGLEPVPEAPAFAAFEMPAAPPPAPVFAPTPTPRATPTPTAVPVTPRGTPTPTAGPATPRGTTVPRPLPTPRSTPAPAATYVPAIIDDTSARAANQKRAERAAALRTHATSEGVMDWARGASAADSEVPGIAVRSGAGVVRSRPRARRGPLLAAAGAVALAALAAGGYFAWSASRTPAIQAVAPPRARIGDTLTLTGANLGDNPGEAEVTIGGQKARVTQAAGSSLKVEVPEVALTPGRDTAAPIVVTAGGRQSKPASVAVYRAPRLKGVAPEVGMPGDVVVLEGTSWGPGVNVRFGSAEAEVVEATATSVKVRVPAVAGGPGTEVPVIATMGADPSNSLEFVLGRVPLVTAIDRRVASAGDLVTVSGRGFDPQPLRNRVTVGGEPALVVSATPRELHVVVPRVIAGESTLELTVPGSARKGQAPLAIDPPADPIVFQFVAEPFEDAPGHEHAAVATALGPVFVLSAGMGKSAAERAHAAQERLNEAAIILRSSREADIRARMQPAPQLFLYGRDTAILDVTSSDAAAYEEDWTRSRVKSAPLTPGRLAAWWEAVARDLVLLLVRGEKPQYAAALAAEGKVLGDLHDAARRRVAVGVPAAIVGEGKGAMRAPLRAIALRVPASVPEPADSGEAAVAAIAPGAAADATPPLRLAGSWNGVETESGSTKAITVVFSGGGGTLTYRRALALSVPITGVFQPQKGVVRFEVNSGAGRLYYRGRWDGSKITGKVYADAGGRRETGSFELEP